VWIRLTMPVVAGEPPTPLARVAAASDFGNGVSSHLSWDTHTFINPDLTIYVHRPPEGEWVCLDATTHYGADGIAMAESALYDTRGRIGRAVQALLVERR
jgi:acyl-CoA thioesterase